MKKQTEFSREHLVYLKKRRNEKIFVHSMRLAILVVFLGLWEAGYRVGLIDGFLFSSPSRIAAMAAELFSTGEIWKHIFATLYETVAGFLLATAIGSVVATALWWNDKLRKILDPYVVVLNSLPKIALGPVIIIWFGSGTKAIVVMAVLISVVVTVLTMLGGFLSVEKNKMLLLTSLGATKAQCFVKLVAPSSLPTFINMLKINIGLSWVGSIMGEYLVSKAGLGYLLVYGGQMLDLDLVYTATIILALLATAMYSVVTAVEHLALKRR